VENPPVEPAPAPASSVRSELMAGMRFMFSSAIVRATLVTAIVVNLGAGSLAALDVYFVGENLHTDPKFFGILAGAFGVGSVIGALGGGFLGDKLGHARVVSVGLSAFGLLTIGYSRCTSVVLAAVIIAVMGVSIGVVNAAVVPVVLKGVPREYLGRVFAVVVPANRFGAIFSILLASVLVSTVLRGLDTRVAGVHLGRIDSVFLAAGVVMVAAGVYFGLATRRR
jgi:MFS family permease